MGDERVHKLACRTIPDAPEDWRKCAYCHDYIGEITKAKVQNRKRRDLMSDFWIGYVCGVLSMCILFVLCIGLSCADEVAERQHWQDCGGVYHEECMDSPDLSACEYEYYKECINEG